MTKPKRNGTIDFMRFVFCMVIVICHSRGLGGTPDIALLSDAGYIGVEFFFIVSGFLMAKSALSVRGGGQMTSVQRQSDLFGESSGPCFRIICLL